MANEKPYNDISKNGETSPASKGSTSWLKSVFRSILPEDLGRQLILRNLWIERRLFFFTLFLTGFSALLAGLGIGLLIPFLENLLNPEKEPFRTGWQWIDTWVLAVDADPTRRLYQISAIILGSIWLRATSSYLSSLCSIRLRESILDRMRRKIIDQVHAVSLSFFSTKESGEIINTLTTEVKRLRNLFDIAQQLLVQSSMIAAYSVAVIWISWQLSLIAVVFGFGLLFMLNNFLENLRDRGRAIARMNGRITSIASEILNGIRTIMVFGTQDFESRNFKRVSQKARDVVVNAQSRSAIVGPLSNGIASTGLIVIILVAVQFLVSPGLMSSAALLAFLVAIMRLLPKIESINSLRAQWSVYRGALENVVDLLRTDDKPYLEDGWRDLDHFADAIELRNLSFAYEPGQPVIKNVNLTISRGETTAFVGSSGAGKSTLADLIARLYDPTDGRILLDGIDLREYTFDALRDTISVVNQSTFLFNQSVRDNIAYGIDGVSDERIREVAEKANAMEFINEMPEGLGTILGERGTRLSGGQRQRIAIARAILRDPEILILDEATSALDSVSEKLVQESLEYLMRGRTVIVIAHRLSTVENADRVVVLEDGEIVEQGKYQDLLDEKGQLWEYHSIQFQLA